MAEAASFPVRLVAYTNSNWNEEGFQFFAGSTSVPDGPFASASMGLKAAGSPTRSVEFTTGAGTLTLTAPNEVAVTCPLTTMQGLAPGLYSWDLVVTYVSGDIETVLAGQVQIVQGIA